MSEWQILFILKKDYFNVNLIFLFYILIFRNLRLGQIVTLMVV